MPQVLMYNLEGAKGAGVRRVAMMLKVRVRPVAPGEYGERLAALAGKEAPAGAEAGEPFPEEMLVFVDFSNGLLDRFLTALRRAKVPPIALKAVLTPTNAQWTSTRLREELTRERDALGKGETAHSNTNQA